MAAQGGMGRAGRYERRAQPCGSACVIGEDPSLTLLGCAREVNLSGVHVPLGDRSLRVVGSRLNVELRITGRGGVRERRVPEVVEGAEGLFDSGPGKRWLGLSRVR